jgi:heme-degrading monooxygenase HmoA
MAIKVLLRRKVPDHKADALRALIAQLRAVTTGQPGYISGETLRRVDRPGEILVISKWKSAYDWQQWFQNPKRRALQRQLDDLLGTPTHLEIYEYD